ncbi:MAG: HRDC domain-containing protein [Planctomycetes bacterium]|nr:HRDC domain-containing protein [Planctomycetota bacterium]
MSHIHLTTDDQLRQFCGQLADCDWIAFDTEFVSERTYRPVLCLIQVATASDLAIIDAVAIDDMTPFWQVVAEPGHETIVHAGRGEVVFCLRAVNKQPAGLFDVQLAAGLMGIEYPASFSTLLGKVLGKTPGSEETRTDWRRRPLSERQIQYALDDVRYLAEIRDALHARLDELGRLSWLEGEMASWQDQAERSVSREQWRRLSGQSGLDRQSLAIVRELWQWRESEAERRNCPVRYVLRDDLIVELAKRKTADLKRIRTVRGLERGDLKRSLPAMAEHIELGLALPKQQWPTKEFRERTPRLAVLGQLLFSALGSVCRHAELAPALVGSPSDVRELVAYRTGQARNDRPPRLAQGWRAEVVGNLFEDLLAGKKSIRIADPTSEDPLRFDDVAG